jgi:uncharacterized membrane protein
MSGIGIAELLILLALVLFVVLIGGLIAAVIWLTKRTAGASRPISEKGAQEPPLDVVRRRYARGEITREEFVTMQQDLTQ